jgi:ADP-heptose:LPS heptosyltransferase
MTDMNNSPRILLVQLFSNGDCLYATAVARQIKKDYPDGHLTWAIADYCQNILLSNPYVDELMVIREINPNNWQDHWKGFVRQLRQFKKEGKFDQVIMTQIIGSNFANYDYCIRSAIFRGYGHPVTVPVQPVLNLTAEEKEKADRFAAENNLQVFGQVVLMEFAPRSGQANFSAGMALSIAETLTRNPSIAVILSSNTKMATDHPAIIDGSVLSLRETAYLSKYCTLLVGCSSGTTWAITSDAGRRLPMLQVLDPNAWWLNSVVNDHKRFGLPVDEIIEISDSSPEKIEQCIRVILDQGFSSARILFHQAMPIRFRMTRGILYYLLNRGDLAGAWKHCVINLRLFGPRAGLLKSIVLGITTFPMMNFLNKRKGKR